jgi:hypothetical protein
MAIMQILAQARPLIRSIVASDENLTSTWCARFPASLAIQNGPQGSTGKLISGAEEQRLMRRAY